jgi:hypothetical protein
VWTESWDNVGVAGYDVYANGVRVGATSSLGFTIFGLSCSTTYTFAVDAFDEAGNQSARTQVSGSTAACAPSSGTSGIDFFVSPSGLDGNPGSSVLPFRSLSRCYAVAGLGQTCGLLSGSYPDARLDAVSSGAKATVLPISQRTVCGGGCVTFVAVPGASPVLAPSGGVLRLSASHVRLLGLAVAGNLNLWPQGDAFPSAQTPDDVDVNGVTGVGALNVACATNFRVENMEIGPSVDVSPLNIQAASAASDCAHNPQWGVVSNVTVHDSSTSDPSNHVDCTHLYDAQNISFDRVLYYGCEHIGLFADSANGPDRCCTGLSITNSIFQATKTGGSTIELGGSSQETTFANSRFANNTIIGPFNLVSNAVFPSSFVIANNIFAQRFNTCTMGSITFRNNGLTLFDGYQGPQEPGTNCAGSGNFRLPSYGSCISSAGSPTSAPDPRLITGTNPCVDTANPSYAPATDYYGNTRTTPPDVGATER